MCESLDPVRTAVPFDEWPKDDRDRWIACFEDREIFDARGPKAKMKDATKNKRQYGYSRWLGYLRVRHPETLALRPEDRIEMSILQGWFESMDGLTSLTKWTYFDSLAVVMALIAPKEDWRDLRDVVNRLRANADPLRSAEEKARDARWLFQAGLNYMDAAETAREHRYLMGSSAFRDGLLVAFLAAHPIRRRALSELTITHHIEKIGSGYVITLYKENLKYGDTYSFPLIAALNPYVERYLDFHRPRLLQGNECDGLWITREGSQLTANGMGGRFAKATPKILGERMTTHAFRHSAATSLLEWDPTSASLIAPLLGHSTDEPGKQHYVARKPSIALSGYQRTIAELRKLRPEGNRA